MKKVKLVLLSVVLSFAANAQDPDPIADTSLWLIDGYGALNFNQVSFTNWAQGGNTSLSLALIGYLQANRHKGKHHWDNFANVQFGIISTEEFGLRKNEDKMEFQTKYGYELSENKKWLLAALANYKSQFARGYNYPDDVTVISRFNSPGYLTLSIGFEYKPVEYFSLFISPVTGRILFVSDQDIANTGMYGNEAAVYDPVTGALITEGEKVRPEFGAYLAANFQKEVVKNVTIMSKLELFNNYLSKESRKSVDVNWETAFLFKVNEWLAASLTLHLLYDKDIMIPKDENDDGTFQDSEYSDRVQFKQALSLGLTYKFNNRREAKE